MAGTFYIHTATLATDTSKTSALNIQYDRPVLWALEVPTMSVWCKTATCNIRLEGAATETGTYRTIGYSNNPATATSGFKAWEVAGDSNSAWIICEAAQFLPFVKVSVTNTSTASTEFRLVGKTIG